MKDNVEFRALFTLPPISPSGSTAISVPEMPAQQTVTGDLEVDAVLWLQRIVATGDQALIDKAMEAVKRVTTPMDELGKRYSAHVARSTGSTMGGVLASFDFGDLEGKAKRAIRKAQDRHEALSRFGTVEALSADTPAEAICIQLCKRVRKDRNGFIDEAAAQKRLLTRPELVPATISDCLLALHYWDDIYRLRNATIDWYGDACQECTAHEWLCFGMLAKLPPQSGAEAIAVYDYLEAADRMGMSETPAILRNLIESAWCACGGAA
ncbi:hypothetical protein EUC41_31050 [Achromobacter denitrificans]|uniref:hypothetical protein n=1 Tax=Achromobacter denitrificans TaxID=32002 RepID=UPI00240D7B52|nr:hypothetical protein [Achromobacter denitrificans]MDX3878155.1 hypothetical protein [Achromobacter sp.]WFC70354.1 hypothetical protein EUC41_31050 [Achromobacter denitrificans]